MSIRRVALLSALTICVAPPTMAGQGWYAGIGVGDNHVDPIPAITAPPLSAHAPMKQDDAVQGSLFAGYKWHSGLRLEGEFGYENHNQQGVNPPFAGTLNGHNKIESALVNAAYDWRVYKRLTLSAGAGVGAARLDMSVTDSLFPGLHIFNSSHTAFLWQATVGAGFDLTPQLQIFADYRYRSSDIDHNYPSDFSSISPIHIGRIQEHVGLLGLRWFWNQH